MTWVTRIAKAWRDVRRRDYTLIKRSIRVFNSNRFGCGLKSHDTMAEWLRRVTRNHMVILTTPALVIQRF